MDQNSLSNYLFLLKHLRDAQEVLLEHHSKIKAMIELLLANDLINFSRENLYNYLWIISDLVDKASKLNKELLDAIIKLD